MDDKKIRKLDNISEVAEKLKLGRRRFFKRLAIAALLGASVVRREKVEACPCGNCDDSCDTCNIGNECDSDTCDPNVCHSDACYTTDVCNSDTCEYDACDTDTCNETDVCDSRDRCETDTCDTNECRNDVCSSNTCGTNTCGVNTCGSNTCSTNTCGDTCESDTCTEDDECSPLVNTCSTENVDCGWGDVWL